MGSGYSAKYLSSLKSEEIIDEEDHEHLYSILSKKLPDLIKKIESETIPSKKRIKDVSDSFAYDLDFEKEGDIILQK